MVLHCGRQWQPTVVTRVIEQVQSSTCVVKVATDLEPGFVKGMGNPQGNETLASELVGSELAAAIGLNVPPFAVITISDLPIQMINGHYISYGPAFVSKAVMGSPGDADGTFLKLLATPEHVPLLVAFDTWVRNLDRCPPKDYLDPTPRWDNLLFSPSPRGRRFEMVVYDHSHCFVEGALGDGLAGDNFVQDQRTFGAFPGFETFLNESKLRTACGLIASIDVGRIRRVVESVPQEWGPTKAVRERWADVIYQRGQRLADSTVSALMCQGQMPV